MHLNNPQYFVISWLPISQTPTIAPTALYPSSHFPNFSDTEFHTSSPNHNSPPLKDYPSPTFAPLMSSSESAQPPSSESSPSPSPPIPTSTINVHLMTTRAKVEISKPKISFTYLTQVSSSTLFVH